jgi:hypothetical protein
MGNNQIKCGDLENFLNVIAGLVTRGITFTADGDTYVITLTGGY